MRLFASIVYASLLIAVSSLQSNAQAVTLFSEDFNSCGLASGWSVSSQGNQNPVWYVGNAVLNDDNNGQSMNGSCFLFIDDDATGDNTPAYTIDFISPVFDISQFPKNLLTVDVHYRDWGPGDEYFDVLLTDGTTEYLLSHFDENRSNGDTLGEYFSLKYDLSFISQSPNVRLIFRYNDAGGYNWWAGVDNILVEGSGVGQNVIAESFNACSKPAGWETEVLTGGDDWQFGVIDTGKALSGANSMDGSCFVYFDDDIIGADAPFSTIRLKSPWFDGTDYGNFTLAFDAILRYWSEKLAVLVEHADGSEYIIYESVEDIGGPFFQTYQSFELDLSAHRAEQMRVVFEYDDGDTWAWWAGLDNIKVTGSGTANDVCANAVALHTGLNCLPASTVNALFDGPPAPCVERSAGGLWYRWVADFTGTAQLTTEADFNDVITVFTGTCANPVPAHCYNRDEHGFTGEKMHFPAQVGVTYLLRVSGRDAGFGAPRGNICVSIAPATAPATPANDLCAGAVTLSVNGAAATGTNANAEITTQPSFNELARADVWYQFTAPALAANEVVEIESQATFSDIITVYSGSCAGLTEVASNHKGQRLALSSLTPGQAYKVQIAGTFATVEGALAPVILKKSLNAPANDHCAAAQLISVGQSCVSGTITGATTSGSAPPCVPTVGGDVWFRFIAPASGVVRMNTRASFDHILAVWEGNCNELTPVACYVNPVRCDGYVSFGALVPGDAYYIQVSARNTTPLPNADFCLHLTDGSQQPEWLPLALTVTEKCIGDNTARLQVSTEGGVAPLTFSGNQHDDVLVTGESWLVVVQDMNGCERSLTGVVKACQAPDCALSGNLNTVQPQCSGSTDGAISAVVTGGVGPYSYKWNNTQTAEILGGLGSGVYGVTITDAQGCELVLGATLNDPTPILVTPVNTLQPSQGASDGAIFIDVAGGSGAYSFSWLKNGVAFIQTEDLTGAPAGAYQLIVTDGNGCTASFDFALTETVGSSDVSREFYTEVYPNPARDKASLIVSFPAPRTIHLALANASGQVLRTWTRRNVMEQNIPLDLKQLPAGQYQLTIRTGSEVLVEKVVVGGR